MSHLRASSLSLFLGAVLAGCASPARVPETGALSGESTQASKTLIVATRAEPPSLSSKPFRSLGLTADLSGRMFNAGLTIRNDAGLPVPYLAEAVPQLNTDSWRVFPDGTMETTYRLKTNATWHDGKPLTASDFVFSYQVYANPDFGLSNSPPLGMMEGVTAPDPRRVVIRWKRTFPDADALAAGGGGSSNTSFPALPRHLLEDQYRSQDAEAFMASSFWTQEYIGAGPYKLDRWEIGAFLEGVSFEGDVLGKPKIQRIREIFLPDPNVVIANLLSGNAQLTSGDSIRFEQGEVVKQQWADRGKVLNFPNLYRIVQFQRRPEFASTEAFTDLRVRKALHHGVDFDTLNEALFGGLTSVATGPIPPTASYYAELDRAVAHYPFDPRRTEQLMTEAGFAKGSDGVWLSPNQRFGRMSFETNVLASPDSDNEMHIMADTWRRLGFDVKEVSWAPALGRDREVRSTFPGLSTTSTPPGENAFGEYRTDRMGTRENRWRGTNRGAWPGTPEYDQLVDIFETGLDRNERVRAVIQKAKILTDDVVVINLYWKLNAQAVANEVIGPRLTDPDGSAEWNIHEWELR